MALRDTFLNMLGVETPEVRKTENSVYKSARDFLRYGNRERLYPTWSDIKMSDSDMYRGYSYAVIQKRGNKVASLAKNNLKTYAKPEIVDEFQKKNEIVWHPYLKLIEDSVKFTEKQFWKNISIYLDLAGRYYLGVIRNEVKPLNPNLPVITTDPTEFIMLNPYEIRRVVDKNGVVAGYIERKSDGRYREWPLHQIIEIRELNPFDPDNSQWAMTDAAKNAVYTINQSGDYTRQSLNGNIDAPGIITTDVLLSDEDFANFRARVVQHTKGEPLFGNGTGAINWDSMQIDLDKAALLDINEINRTELFAVSGTSKTSLGIEQSGTTRETARVQSEQFISDTAQPRLEDIVDFLNLDYKRHYKREYDKTGYKIEVESAVGKDYDTEQKATALKQSQFQLAMQLIQSGYTAESAYQFAEGEIDFADLELEKGIDKPKSIDNPDDGEDLAGNASNSQNTPPQSGSGGGDDKSIVSDKEAPQNANNALESELEPHAELVENGGKGSGNFGHFGRPGEVGGSGPKMRAGNVSHQSYSSDGKNIVAEWDEAAHPIYPDEYIIKGADQIGMVSDAADNFGIARKAYAVRDKKLKNPFEVFEPIDDAEETHVREYMKATFKIDDKELDRLLDNTKTKNSLEDEKCNPLENLEVEGCTCEHDHKIETLFNEVQDDHGQEVRNAYDEFLKEIRKIEKETVTACVNKVNINAFEEDDIIGKVKKKNLITKLKNALHKYWWAVFPILANNSMASRNKEYGENVDFVFTNELQAGVDDNAQRVAEGHMSTILGDILEASNKAYTNVAENAAAELIIEAYKRTPENYATYFDHEPTMADALSSIRKTDILEQNRRIYEKANKMAFEGYKREDIVKSIREEYKDISKNRAELIAQNETSRAFSRSQYEADKQFLNSIGKLDQAFKQLVSRRPANEQDKICPICQALINEGPVPFDEPFLKYGESIEVQDGDKTRIFTANYEDIEGGTVHPRCYCHYELVFKNDAGEFVKTLNYNDKHEPAGSPKGGQFARKDGSSVPKSLEELKERTNQILQKGQLEKEKILEGAYESEKWAKFLSNDPANARIATEQQLEQLDELNRKVTGEIREVTKEYWKSQGEYIEPGFYRDETNDQVYEVVEEWGSEEGGDTKQISYPIDSTHSSTNRFLLYNRGEGLTKISEDEAKESIRDGDTLGGISKRDEITLNIYSRLTPQNEALRKGESIDSIKSAKDLQNIINRTKSNSGTFYRGFAQKSDAERVASLEIGDIYGDKGFMSTSRNKSVAKSVSDDSGVKVLLEVVSKGGYGKSINITPYSSYPNEEEELFNAGSKGKVTKTRIENGYKIVTMELE